MLTVQNNKHRFQIIHILLPSAAAAVFILCVTLISNFYWQTYLNWQEQTHQVRQGEQKTLKQLSLIQKELAKIKNEDQYVLNKNLQSEIDNIQKTYSNSVDVYEKLADLRPMIKSTQDFDTLFAKSLSLLSKRNYASSQALLSDLNNRIQKELDKIAQTAVITAVPQNLPADNNPPSSGYRRQMVVSEAGSFMVDIITADLNSTRVIVDTASESDCHDNCPVLPLSDYVSRNGAYAGINGAYFCPAAYPSCSDKKNSFDTLLMNKNKKYFNSDNNVYSVVPAVIFLGSSLRFVSRSLEWGRDTGVDGVIANYPLLTINGDVAVTGSSDPKLNSKGARSFIGSRDNFVYMGFVHNASIPEAAKVVKALNISNAIHMDDGGSAALWFNGYKLGPGRNIPNAVLFILK